MSEDEPTAFTQLWNEVATELKAANAKHAALLKQKLATARTGPEDSPELAYLLANVARPHLEQELWAEAESLLRECLTLREKIQPEQWTTYNTYSSSAMR